MLKNIVLMLLFCIACFYTTFAQWRDGTSPQADTAVNTVNSPNDIDTSTAAIVIADVKISGYKKTKLYIIEREVPFHSGDIIFQSKLKALLQLCKQQLVNTSLFVEVEVAIAKQQDDLVFININVKERWYLFPLPYFKIVDRNFNEWIVTHNGSLTRVNYGLKFIQNNVSGRNDNLNIWLVNGYTQQVSFRYENPFLDKSLKHGINVGFSYSRNREINYATNYDTLLYLKENYFLTRQIRADIAYTYRPAIKTRHSFRLSYNDQLVHDTVIRKNPKFFPNGARSARFVDLSYTLQYFDVDYISYPLKGFMGEASFYKRGISGENNIWQIEGRGTYSFKVLPAFYMQFQGAGLIRLPFKQPYTAQELFGSNDFYLRGLEYYVINGVAGGLARATAIKQLLSFTVKNPVHIKTLEKIPFRVYLKGYGDAGYAYNTDPQNSRLNNRLMHTVGAGIDVVTFYDIVVKLEYSINQLGESGFFFHTKADF